MTIIGTKWVYENKLDEKGVVSRNKARLVAQCYNQQEDIDYDDTYVPAARSESIRILLAYACTLDFKLFQMDVKSAFANSFIIEEDNILGRDQFKNDSKDQYFEHAYLDWATNIPAERMSGVSCGKRHERVITLWLDSQGLEGSLSPHVGKLSFLRMLSLSNNSFQGSIPREIGRLPRLLHLYLDENIFSGVIPSNLSSCSNLKKLWLDGNKLVGSIPKETSLFAKLTMLVIYDNKLTGGILPFLGNITSMETFSASWNPLGGSISDILGLWKA
nr:protein kinase-like domain-containing protein [Tanacetum cinerariifolium]